MKQFEDFLCDKNSSIDEAAFKLLVALGVPSDAEPDELIEGCFDVAAGIKWDQYWISQVVDAAEQVLERMGVGYCHPYHVDDDEKPCYLDDSCEKNGCPFRKKGAAGENHD